MAEGGSATRLAEGLGSTTNTAESIAEADEVNPSFIGLGSWGQKAAPPSGHCTASIKKGSVFDDEFALCTHA